MKTMKRTIASATIVVVLSVFGAAAPPNLPAAAFTGHNCRIATCRFFTSSYSTAHYYYDRRTCGQWRSLSRTYLQGFRSRTALLNHFHRRLHPPC
jgi:hypothetical protein